MFDDRHQVVAMASTDLFTVRVVEIENKSNTNVDNGNDVDSHSEDIHQNNAKPDQVCHQQGLSTIEEHQNLISARVLRVSNISPMIY